MTDRFGLGWRPDLAAGILGNLDRIDVVEVMADDYLDAPRRKLDALRTLSKQVPMVLHSVSLGLASTVPVDERRLEAMARLVNALDHGFWSDHLAFVRAGDIELGHLVAPPRNLATVTATADNIRRAARVIGSKPVMENIATLIDPPGSDLTEPDWVTAILEEADTTLLFDLHNVYVNASNFGFDPATYVAAVPPRRVSAIHLAGGQWIDEPADGATTRGARRLLDDHKHPVPPPVYDLLTAVASRTSHPLTVILEYDGDYPPFAHLLDQLDRARNAVARGRLQGMSQEGAA